MIRCSATFDHGDQVCALAFRPDGRMLASAGCRVDAVILWDVARGNVRARLPKRLLGPVGLAFTADSRYLYVGGSACVFDAETGRAVRTLKTQDSVGSALVVSPDGRSLVMGGLRGLTAIDTATGLQHWQETWWDGTGVGWVAMTRDGTTLAEVYGGKSLVETEWWLESYHLPRLYWARLRVFDDGTADACFEEGATLYGFESRHQASMMLEDDEYVHFWGWDEEDEQDYGIKLEEIRTPTWVECPDQDFNYLGVYYDPEA
jgi:hypothetical protein